MASGDNNYGGGQAGYNQSGYSAQNQGQEWNTQSSGEVTEIAWCLFNIIITVTDFRHGGIFSL